MTSSKAADPKFTPTEATPEILAWRKQNESSNPFYDKVSGLTGDDAKNGGFGGKWNVFSQQSYAANGLKTNWEVQQAIGSDQQKALQNQAEQRLKDEAEQQSGQDAQARSAVAESADRQVALNGRRAGGFVPVGGTSITSGYSDPNSFGGAPYGPTQGGAKTLLGF